MLLDADGIIKRGKCKCSHHFKGGLRMGPCRHLLAMRAVALGERTTGRRPASLVRPLAAVERQLNSAM